MRLRADIWVSAYLRRCMVEGAFAALRRRGAAEAGAIIVKIDRLDGTGALFGAAPPSVAAGTGERLFAPLHREPWIASADAEARLARQIAFDPDLWIVEVEDREGRSFLALAE